MLHKLCDMNFKRLAEVRFSNLVTPEGHKTLSVMLQVQTKPNYQLELLIYTIWVNSCVCTHPVLIQTLNDLWKPHYNGDTIQEHFLN